MNIPKDICPPFYVIPMPLDKDGRGPADESETVRTEYQVWDAVNRTLATFDNYRAAEDVAVILNKFIGDLPKGNDPIIQLRMSDWKLIQSIMRTLLWGRHEAMETWMRLNDRVMQRSKPLSERVNEAITKLDGMMNLQQQTSDKGSGK